MSYSIKLYISITKLRSFGLSICGLFTSFMQSVNCAQYLNISCLSFLSAAFAALSAPAPATIMARLTSMYTSL